jgi:chromosome segregation ATPase
MMDRVTELENEVKQLKAALANQATSKDHAYDDLATQGRRIDELERELTEVNALFAHESAQASTLAFEVTLYRDRYRQVLTRFAVVGRAVTIANAARAYLAAIERRGSLEDDVVAHLERLREEVGFSLDPDVNPLHVLISERDDELETLRRRVAELKDDRATLTARAEAAEGHAADWQELAETTDRKLVTAQQKLKRQEQPGGN